MFFLKKKEEKSKCEHEFEIIKNERFDGKLIMDTFEVFEIRKSFAKRGVITVSRCKKCGKVEHTKTIL